MLDGSDVAPHFCVDGEACQLQPGLCCRVVETDGHDPGTDGNDAPLRADAEERLERLKVPGPQLELSRAGVVLVLSEIDPKLCCI